MMAAFAAEVLPLLSTAASSLRHGRRLFAHRLAGQEKPCSMATSGRTTWNVSSSISITKPSAIALNDARKSISACA
ncbi:hypothetical protein [Curvibacter sp. PAE-UM]|uniref:hypothetical protein n=1 Tax=Curvibacter sp. PAE-UM TaxID=1714344 RepID=UPI000AD84F62|nr:hypothetical protein [Curvibacter sp. PAE-UM]